MKKQLRAAEEIIITTIFLTFLVCQGLYAAEETLPTPEEIIAKNIEAIGGIKALKKIKNKKIVQIRRFDQMNLAIKDTIYQERPNNSYTVMDTGVRERSNDKMAWHVGPNGNIRPFKEGDGLSRYLMESIFDGPDGPEVNYKSMKTEGMEQINGKACYKVVKTPVQGPQRIVYYDINSYMILKITMYMQGNDNHEIIIEKYIEGYKKINNILFPYKVVTFINGQKYQEAITEKIELNIEMPEGIFDIPEEVKAIMNKK